MSRGKFFLIALVCSFAWYTVPGYFFYTLTAVSWVCWVFPKSVTAQQIGSGMQGLGLGAFSLDWATVASFLGSPLVTPFFAIANVTVGYILVIYLMMPLVYWGFNLYNANSFPIFSKNLFDSQGQDYNVSAIVNPNFEIDLQEYEKHGRVNLSVFFAMTYGIGFAAIVATLSHVALFNGRYI